MSTKSQLATTVPILIWLTSALLVAQAPNAVLSNPNLITSINYGQSATGGSSYMDIHVALQQPSENGFPCQAGGTATVDSLLLTQEDVKSVDGTAAHINTADLRPASEQGGYVFHVPVGTNLDLPATWDSFAFQVVAHCTNSTQTQLSPKVTLRRFAVTDPLQISIADGKQQWVRSGGHDTLSFLIKASRAVSIQALVVRDTQAPFNVVTEAYSDVVDSTSHNVNLTALDKFQDSHQYAYEITMRAGGIPITPVAGLPMFTTPQAPTQDYALIQPPNPNQLTIRDGSNDFSFTVIASERGSLDVQFDSLTIQSTNSNAIHSENDAITHTFKIAKTDIPADGQYSFHFVGHRAAMPSDLNGQYESTLIVLTKTTVKGPIGLSLKNGAIVVTYCLSQITTNSIKIAPGSNPSSYYVGADGQAAGTVGCGDGAFGYTASVPLTDFSAKVNSGGGASPPAAQPAAGGSTAAADNKSSATTVPIQLFILTSPGSEILATLSLDAVLLNTSQPQSVTAITDALTKITDKNSSADQKAAATKTLQSAGLKPDAITALSKLGKSSSNVTGAIGTILGTVGKSLAATYFGIPAPSSAAPAATAQPTAQ